MTISQNPEDKHEFSRHYLIETVSEWLGSVSMTIKTDSYSGQDIFFSNTWKSLSCTTFSPYDLEWKIYSHSNNFSIK